MLGLSLAWRLRQAGAEVSVYEAAPEFGGLAAPWRIGPVTWDRYYHVILLSDLRLRALLRDLDLEREIVWRTVGSGLYADGRMHNLTSALDYLRLPVLPPLDKLRLALTILGAARITDGSALEDVPVEAWLTRRSGRAAFERIWRPLLAAKLGENYKVASAAFIWAVIRRLYAARRSGMKVEKFGYVPGGYARILDRLVDKLRAAGVALHAGAPIRRVGARDGQPTLTFADGQQRGFDRIVVTTAAGTAARLCPELTAQERDRLTGIRYQGVVCASLLLETPLSPHYLAYITDPGFPFTTVVQMSTLVDPASFGGRHLVYLPRYVTAEDKLADLPDTEIAALFLDGLARMFPDFRPSHVQALRIARTRDVLAVPTLGYSARLPPVISSIPGLSLLSSAHIVNGTLNVDETVGLVDSHLPLLLREAPAGLAGTHAAATPSPKAAIA